MSHNSRWTLFAPQICGRLLASVLASLCGARMVLFGRLAVGRSVGLSVGWSGGRPVDSSVSLLVGRSMVCGILGCRAVARLTIRSVGRLFGLQICKPLYHCVCLRSLGSSYLLKHLPQQGSHMDIVSLACGALVLAIVPYFLCYFDIHLKLPIISISEWVWMIWICYNEEEWPPVRSHRERDEGGTSVQFQLWWIDQPFASRHYADWGGQSIHSISLNRTWFVKDV